MADVRAAEDESIFLLHACAHNPTGVDPTREQWAELSKLMKTKKQIAFFVHKLGRHRGQTTAVKEVHEECF